jgi:hypothetical protein
MSGEPSLAVTVGLLSNLGRSRLFAVPVKPFLPVGEIPRLERLPLVAIRRLGPKRTESRVRRQVNETVEIGQGVRLDTGSTSLLLRRRGFPEHCAPQDPSTRVREATQHLQRLPLITVGMIGSDAQDKVDWFSLGRCDSFDESDPVVESSLTRVAPRPLEHHAVGVDADTCRCLARAQDPKEKFRPSTSDVQRGTRSCPCQGRGDRVGPSTGKRSIEVEELVVTRRRYVCCHARQSMAHSVDAGTSVVVLRPAYQPTSGLPFCERQGDDHLGFERVWSGGLRGWRVEGRVHAERLSAMRRSRAR